MKNNHSTNLQMFFKSNKIGDGISDHKKFEKLYFSYAKKLLKKYAPKEKKFKIEKIDGNIKITHVKRGVRKALIWAYVNAVAKYMKA